jgi:hypothetical protein
VVVWPAFRSSSIYKRCGVARTARHRQATLSVADSSAGA